MWIDADGSVYPCVATFHRLRGGNAATDGVAAAWRRTQTHPCVACYSPCLVEQNFLFARSLGATVAVIDDGRVIHRGGMAELAADEALQTRLLSLSLAAHQ